MARTPRGGAARDDGSVPVGPIVVGQVLGGRYQLSGQPRGTGVAGLDVRSGAEVQLDAVPLPEIVEPFDQVAFAATGASGAADSTARRALSQSAFVAGAVPDHPRLSQAFQVFEEGGYLWVAGESVPGLSLTELLQRGTLSPYRAAELGHDLVAALRAVHSAGLVHGNLTGETVTVCADGTALLGGLVVGTAQETLCGGPGAELPGAAVPEAPWSPARTRARDARSVIVGVVAERWAPEQVGPGPVAAVRAAEGRGRPQQLGPVRQTAGQPGGQPVGQPGASVAEQQQPRALPVGPEADAWALGVLLYRAMTGEPPFPEQDADTLFAAVRWGEVRSVAADARPALPARGTPRDLFRPPLPECGPLGSLVHGLLRPDPGERLRLGEAAELIRQLLVRAPEPLNQAELVPVAALLPMRRQRGEVLEHPDFPSHRHAAPHRHPALLGIMLFGGIILFVVVALGIVVMTSR